MTAVHPEASRQAVVEAALVLLERMGLSPADLAAVPQHRQEVPTFAEYVPIVSAAVSAGTRRVYGSYWNRVLEHWGARRLDEPTPSEIRQLMACVKTHVVARRNARGGRSAEEHLVAALLTQRAGAARAKEMALLGRRYPASALERWNVINFVVADENLDSATMVIAQELAHGPSIAHAATKRLVSIAVTEGLAAADNAMAEIQRPIFRSADFRAAVSSYRENGIGMAEFEGR